MLHFSKLVIALLMPSALVIAADKFKTLHVEDLNKLLNDKAKKVFVFDANGRSTREKVGIIPGATLLNDSSEYALDVLPKNKTSKLVFYCANTMCMASHTAAERAIANGYKDVAVMVDGIYGWRDAGHKTEPFSQEPKKMKPKEVSELVKKGAAVIVDVRENEERHEIIADSKWTPMSKLGDKGDWTSFVKDLPKDKIIVFHCAAGARAKKVAERLSAEGVKTAYFKSADEWKDDGLPVVAGPAK